MSRLIDEEKYESDLLKVYDDVSIELDVLDKQQTVNAIIIPEGATNGDMIMAMFPNISIYEHGATYSVNNEYNFNSTWWNAPYKAESEDKE